MTSVTMNTLKNLTTTKPQRRSGRDLFNQPGRFGMTLLRVIDDCGPKVTLTRLMNRFSAAHLICMQRRFADRTAQQRAMRATTQSSIGKLQFALTKLERRGYVSKHVITLNIDGKPTERWGWSVTARGRRQL